MSTSLFRCYVDELEPLRAERTLDLSQAAAFPHLADDARKSWVQRLVDMVTRKTDDDGETSPRHFNWNGVWLGARRLKAKMVEAFGGSAAA